VTSSSNDGDTAHIGCVSGTVRESVKLGNTMRDHSVPGAGQYKFKLSATVCVQMYNIFFNFAKEGFDVALDKERANERVNAVQRLMEHVDALAGRTVRDMGQLNGWGEGSGGLGMLWEGNERLPGLPETGRRVREQLGERVGVKLRCGGGKERVVCNTAIAPAARSLADGRGLLRHGFCSICVEHNDSLEAAAFGRDANTIAERARSYRPLRSGVVE
jgi:hypothetical protein